MWYLLIAWCGLKQSFWVSSMNFRQYIEADAPDMQIHAAQFCVPSHTVTVIHNGQDTSACERNKYMYIQTVVCLLLDELCPIWQQSRVARPFPFISVRLNRYEWELSSYETSIQQPVATIISLTITLDYNNIEKKNSKPYKIIQRHVVCTLLRLISISINY